MQFIKELYRKLFNDLFPAATPPGIAALTTSSTLPRRFAPEQGTGSRLRFSEPHGASTLRLLRCSRVSAAIIQKGDHMTNKYSEDYRHFDNLIWQVPAWSTALFLLSFSGIDTSSAAIKVLTQAANLLPETILASFLAFASLVIFVMSHVLYRFRVHQSNTNEIGNQPFANLIFSAQFWLQLLVTSQAMWLIFLLVRVKICVTFWSWIVPLLILVLITIYRENQVRQS
jgi:hypothetical protein